MRFSLVLVLTLLNSAMLPSTGVVEVASCSIGSPTDSCTVDNIGTEVDVGVDHHETIDPPPPPPPPTDHSNNGTVGTGESRDDGTGHETMNDPRCLWSPGAPTPDFCFDETKPEKDAHEETPEPPSVVTASQLLSFAPPAPEVATEPDGVAIVGMPANVVAPAASSASSGTLLGFPVSVSFTPERLAIDYGDGEASSVAAKSATWAELGQAEFTATTTSHAYRQRGTYAISVRVLYSASVDFGEYGTVPVTGLVSSQASTASVRAVTAETGLVERTCSEPPAGPGC